VTRRFAWRHVPYLATALGISAIGQTYFSGHRVHPELAETFQEAAVYSLLSGALLTLILTGPLDHQFILSIVRSLFFLAIFYNLCALMSAFAPGMLVHNLFIITAMVFGSVKLVVGGLARYYWLENQIGDFMLELIPVLLFVLGSGTAGRHLLMRV